MWLDVHMYLLIALPISFGCILWFLSTNERFLSTWLGGYIFVQRDFYDVNQTAFAFDSTGPSSDEAQASETFAKNVFGRVLPDLEDYKSPPMFVTDDKFLFTKEGTYPYVTYYEHLTKNHSSKDIVKEKAATCVQKLSSSSLVELHACYVNAMQNKSFSPSFQTMFLARRAFKSFHTFGKDMKLLKLAVEGVGYRWREFLSQSKPFDEVMYTEILANPRQKWGQTYTAEEFYKQSCLDAKCCFLVQENYDLWAQSGKSNDFGKRAEIPFHPFQIRRWLAFDDVDCWKKSNVSCGGRFLRVNAVRAALEPDYFQNLISKYEIPIWGTAGFWSLLFFWTVSHWLLIQIIDITPIIALSIILLPASNYGITRENATSIIFVYLMWSVPLVFAHMYFHVKATAL